MYTDFFGIPLGGDGHSTVTWHQLTHWQECPSWAGFKASPYTAGGRTVRFDRPCDFFTTGSAKATTLSLTVIVVIEMLNSFNALSENSSLLTARCPGGGGGALGAGGGLGRGGCAAGFGGLGWATCAGTFRGLCADCLVAAPRAASS